MGMAIPAIMLGTVINHLHIGDPWTVGIVFFTIEFLTWTIVGAVRHAKTKDEATTYFEAGLIVSTVTNVLVTVPCILFWGVIALIHVTGGIGSTGIWLLIGTAIFCVMCWLGNKKLDY
jgi:hypothetical protein